MKKRLKLAPRQWNYLCAWLGMAGSYWAYEAIVYGVQPIRGYGYLSSDEAPYAYVISLSFNIFMALNLAYVVTFLAWKLLSGNWRKDTSHV